MWWMALALAGPPDLQTGDLVFHRSRSRQAAAIAAATASPLTHVGVVVVEQGEPWVYEAIQPVSRTPLETWAARAADGRIEIHRLAAWDPGDGPALQVALSKRVGRPYDTAFTWDDERLYCSELVYKVFDEVTGVQLGARRAVGSFHVDAPGVAEALERRGIALSLEVVSPSDQAADEDLRLVCRGTVAECVP
jgi:cell wall-associated NlpC family hydrolase